MGDFGELAARYTTPLEDLDPEERRDREDTMAYLDELKRQGKFASPQQLALQDFPIGLDDKFRPFPVDPSPWIKRADEPTEDLDHD